MSGDQMKYQFEAIHGTAEAIAGQGAALQGQNDTLKSYVNNLVGNWDGQARTEYQQKQHEWDTSFQSLQDTLHVIVSRVHEAADAMQHTENMNAGTWT